MTADKARAHPTCRMRPSISCGDGCCTPDARATARRLPDRTKSESWKDGGVHGAPGPIAGAGLPVIAIGYGAFWLYRRYRRRPD